MFGLSCEDLLGKPTLHVPINLIVQKMDAETLIGVWQMRHEAAESMCFGSEKTHQLILGDAFIRPKLVADSNEFTGSGASVLLTNGFAEIEKWNPIFHRG